MNSDEIRSLAARVRDLRQELESVEARLRELSGDGAPLAPLEPIDSPTVLTTNHAQRRARVDRLVPLVTALGAVMVLGGGIAIGYALRPTPPAALPPATPVALASEAPTATVPAAEPPSASTASAAPGVSAAPPEPSAASSVVPARSTVAPPPRQAKVDRGF